MTTYKFKVILLGEHTDDRVEQIDVASTIEKIIENSKIFKHITVINASVDKTP